MYCGQTPPGIPAGRPRAVLGSTTLYYKQTPPGPPGRICTVGKLPRGFPLGARGQYLAVLLCTINKLRQGRQAEFVLWANSPGDSRWASAGSTWQYYFVLSTHSARASRPNLYCGQTPQGIPAGLPWAVLGSTTLYYKQTPPGPPGRIGTVGKLPRDSRWAPAGSTWQYYFVL